MIKNISKVFLGIYSALLLIIIFLTPSENFGFFLLVGTGLFSLVLATLIANDVKKFTGSAASRIFTIVLVNLILYSTIFVFYGLGNIGMGDKGLVFLFSLAANLVLLVVSLITGIILVTLHKDQVVEAKPNKILAIILVIILIILFYSSGVSGIAGLTSNPSICSMHVEIKSNSFIFVKGMQDSCISRVALNTSNISYCKQIQDTYVDLANSQKNLCILNVARDLGDKNACYQITNDDQRQGDCIRYIAENKADLSMCETPGIDRDMCYLNIARGKKENGNPEICNNIKNNEGRYHCYSIIAIDKRDSAICERYFPSDEVLVSEGVNPENYSRKECINDAKQGYF